MNLRTRSLALLITAFMLLSLPAIDGNSSGIHNQASTGCTCHYSGSAPTINQNFPSTYTGGQSYTIQISAQGGVSGNNGGFNVLVDKGTLSTPGVGIMAVKVDSSGLSATHTTSSYRSWSFDWTAPATGSGTVNVDIAVLTANSNSGTGGDAWARTSITVPEPGPTNTPPTASNVFISDASGSTNAVTTAYYDADLFANYDFNDPDNDAESGTKIRWIKGTTTMPQHNDMTMLSQSATSIGDLWKMTVTPSDGTDDGTTITSSNTVEIIDYDTDGDGYGDQSDAFPNDENEWADADDDGVGDNADDFDNDATQTTDSDDDGYGDNPQGNNPDAFPNDPNEWEDSDDDGVGDNGDAFPNDPTETDDSDNDGVGDNADAFPNDPTETDDTDEDGVATTPMPSITMPHKPRTRTATGTAIIHRATTPTPSPTTPTNGLTRTATASAIIRTGHPTMPVRPLTATMTAWVTTPTPSRMTPPKPMTPTRTAWATTVTPSRTMPTKPWIPMVTA